MTKGNNGLQYFADRRRHLVCVPYTVDNLHLMAEDLGIKGNWFHLSARRKHYDIPKRRIEEILGKVNVVSTREIISICKGERNGD